MLGWNKVHKGSLGVTKGCRTSQTNQPSQTTPLVQISDLSPYPGQPGGKRAYHAMIKPQGSICNLDCTYCYYLHKQDLSGKPEQIPHHR